MSLISTRSGGRSNIRKCFDATKHGRGKPDDAVSISGGRQPAIFWIFPKNDGTNARKIVPTSQKRIIDPDKDVHNTDRSVFRTISDHLLRDREELFTEELEVLT